MCAFVQLRVREAPLAVHDCDTISVYRRAAREKIQRGEGRSHGEAICIVSQPRPVKNIFGPCRSGLMSFDALIEAQRGANPAAPYREEFCRPKAARGAPFCASSSSAQRGANP